MTVSVSKRRHQLMAVAAAMLVLLLAGELYHHLSVKPVVLPRLLFELTKIVLLSGCAVAGTLLIFRVRAPQMAMAAAIVARRGLVSGRQARLSMDVTPRTA